MTDDSKKKSDGPVEPPLNPGESLPSFDLKALDGPVMSKYLYRTNDGAEPLDIQVENPFRRTYPAGLSFQDEMLRIEGPSVWGYLDGIGVEDDGKTGSLVRAIVTGLGLGCIESKSAGEIKSALEEGLQKILEECSTAEEVAAFERNVDAALEAMGHETADRVSEPVSRLREGIEAKKAALDPELGKKHKEFVKGKKPSGKKPLPGPLKRKR